MGQRLIFAVVLLGLVMSLVSLVYMAAGEGLSWGQRELFE
jgi:hypothetical protein